MISPRILTAVISAMFLTVAPAAYQLVLRNKPSVNFVALTEILGSTVLTPTEWDTADADYQFDEQWSERLELQSYRAVNTATAQGNSLNILLMLSENGEQKYHTPEICYESIGCRIEGESIDRTLQTADLGEYRLVEVTFPGVGEKRSAVAAWAYWTGEEWVAPDVSSVLNTIGQEPFLLKIQVLLNNRKLNSPGALEALDDYMAFLGDRLRELDLAKVAFQDT